MKYPLHRWSILSSRDWVKPTDDEVPILYFWDLDLLSKANEAQKISEYERERLENDALVACYDSNVPPPIGSKLKTMKKKNFDVQKVYVVEDIQVLFAYGSNSSVFYDIGVRESKDNLASLL